MNKNPKWDGETALNAMIHDLSEEIFSRREQVIKAGLDVVDPGWTVERLKDRVRRTRVLGERMETWYFDEKPFLILYDIEPVDRGIRYPFKIEDGLTEISYRFRYQYLPL